jgi:hypothetical protein
MDLQDNEDAMKLLERLEARDRRVMYLALPVIAVLLIYIVVIEPLSASRQAASQRLDTALANIAWLQQQASENRLATAQCRPDLETDTAEALAARLGVSLEEVGDRLRVRTGNGNDVLALVRNLPCIGHRVAGFELSAIDGDGNVDGWIALAPM